MDAATFLGADIELVPPADRRDAILRACVKCWFEKNPTGTMNWGDCSGFLKSVQRELLLRPFDGLANDIASYEVYTRTDWSVLGVGSAAAKSVEHAVEAGRLVIAAWAAAAGTNGHVMIITMRASYAGVKPEQQFYGSWGQLHSVGRTFGSLSKSFGTDKHGAIVYASCNDLIFPLMP